jgi:hypothetical protein
VPFARFYREKTISSACCRPGLRDGRRLQRITAALAVTAALTLGLTACGEDRTQLSAAAEQAMPVPESTSTATPPAPAGTSPTPRRAAAAKPHAGRTTEPAAPTTAAKDAGSGNSGLDRFVTVVQKQLPDVALDRRDEEVEELGQEACSGLAAGKTPAAVAGGLSDDGVSAPDARKLVTIAGQSLCR